MYYFSLHAQDGTHLGFLIMQPDSDTAQNGRFVTKPADDVPAHFQAAASVLSDYQQPDAQQTWQGGSDGVTLSANQRMVGTVRNEFLKLDGQMFVLNDLTGAV